MEIMLIWVLLGGFTKTVSMKAQGALVMDRGDLENRIDLLTPCTDSLICYGMLLSLSSTEFQITLRTICVTGFTDNISQIRKRVIWGEQLVRILQLYRIFYYRCSYTSQI